MIYPEIIAYILGSIPFGYLVARVFFKTDIRKGGSGNIGATNALRQFGTAVGVGVLLLDMLKGIAAVLIAKALLPVGSPELALCALFAILGHVFPVWLGFKGGKGVATAAGVFLALTPYSVLIALGVFIIVVALSRHVSLGSMSAALALGISHMVYQLKQDSTDWALLILIYIVVVVIFVMHRENIKRLAKGEESKLNFTKKGSK